MKKSVLLLFIFQFSLLTAVNPADSVTASDYPDTADASHPSENAQTTVFSFSHDASHILGNKTGRSWLFSWNAAGLNSGKEQSESVSGTYAYFTSNLELLNGNISTGSISGKARNSQCSFLLNLQAASSDKMTLKLGKPWFYQDNLSFCSGKAGLTLNTPVNLQPFAIISDLSSQNGSFYFFYGLAEGTPVKAAGLEARYNNHTVSLLYGTSHISVSEPKKNTLLATADASFLNAVWSYPYKSGKWNFSSSLGYTGIFPDINLRLTKGNQQYLGFPFEFMNFSITGRMDILSFSQKNVLNLKNGRLSLNVEGLSCFYSDFHSFIEWQYKDSTAALYRMLFESLSITADSSGYTKSDFRNLQFVSFLLPEIVYDCTIKKRSFTMDISASKKLPLAFKFGNYGKSVIETWTSDGKPLPLSLDFAEFLTAKDIFSSAADYLFAGITLSIALVY